MDDRQKISDTLRIGDQEFEYRLVPIGEKILKIWHFLFVRKMPDGSTTTKTTGNSSAFALRVVRWVSSELRKIVEQFRDDIRIIAFVVPDKTLARIHRLSLDRFAAEHDMEFYTENNPQGKEVFFIFDRKVLEDPERLIVPRDIRISSSFGIKKISSKLRENLGQKADRDTGAGL